MIEKTAEQIEQEKVNQEEYRKFYNMILGYKKINNKTKPFIKIYGKKYAVCMSYLKKKELFPSMRPEEITIGIYDNEAEAISVRNLINAIL